MKHLKVLRSTLQVLCSILVLSFILSIPRPSYGANGVNKVINFQGKVTNASGTNVTDGTYDFVIKIYDGAGSGASTLFTETWSSAALWSSQMSSAPSSGGESLTYSTGTNESTIKVGQILWNTTKKESVIITSVDTGTNVVGISPTRQAWNTTDTVTNRIYVKDGVFKVAINSLNVNISGVNFGTDNIFMGVEFNGDGEMKPRIQYTATPYAMNAEKVNGLTVTNTSDNPFSSTTTLKIGDGKTVQIDNGLRFTGTDGTQFTFPNATGTVVTTDSVAVLTNKSIGSGGLTYSGADTDITTGTNEHFSIVPNGTGNVGIGTTTPHALFHVLGQPGTAPTASISAKSSFTGLLVDNTIGHIFTASAAGSSRFVIGQSGVITGTGFDASHLEFMSDYDLSVIGDLFAGGNSEGITLIGNTVSAGYAPGYVGTDLDLVLKAAGLGYIIMDGSVGIGTTNVDPYRLNVNGGTNITGVLTGLTGLTLQSGAITLGGSTGSGQCLTGGATASWGACSGGSTYVPWVQNNTLGLLYPVNSTLDFLFGGQSSSSAKFKLSPSGAQPVASISGTTGQAALIVDNNGTGDLFTASSSGLARFVIRQNGNVGIGKSNPTSKLDLVASTSAVGDFNGAVIETNYSPTTESDGIGAGMLVNFRTIGATGDLTSSDGNFGIWGIAAHTSSGTVSNLKAIASEISNTSLITNAYSSYNLVTNLGSIANSYAGYFKNYNSTGTITSGYGLYVDSSSNIAGTFTNNYGLYINDQSGVGSTNSFNLYSAGANAKNFFQGFVGVGTTAPQAKLHVVGGNSPVASISATSAFAGLVVDQAGAGDILSASASGLPRFSITNGGGIKLGTSVGTSSQCLLGGATASWGACSVGSSQWDDVSGGINYAGGNVGIGTTTPNAKLHLLGDFGTTTTASISARSSFAGLVVDNTVGDLFTASSSGLNRFVIKQNGNVGVGTTSPTSKLYIQGQGTSSATSGLHVVDSGGASNLFVRDDGFVGMGSTSPLVSEDLRIGDGSDGDLWVNIHGQDNIDAALRLVLGVWDGDNQGFMGTATAHGFQFRTENLQRLSFDTNGNATFGGQGGEAGFIILKDTGNITKAFFSPNSDSYFNGGDVGIGTTSPDAKLHVVGDFGTGATASISARSSFAGLVVDNTVGDLFTASSSGLARFTIKQNGDVVIPSDTQRLRFGSATSSNHLYSSSSDLNISFSTSGNGIIFKSHNGSTYSDIASINPLGSFQLGNGIVTKNHISSHNAVKTYFNNTNVGIGTTDPMAGLQVAGFNATSPTASISANTNFAGLVIDNKIGDLLTASASGLARFVIKNNGNVGIGLSNPEAAKFTISDSSLAPGVDLALISATTGTTTTGVDGLQVDFANSGSGVITNSGLTINVTSNNTNSSSTLYGINIAALLSGGENANEYALNIGSGWDRGIVIGSGGATNSGLIYVGSGRPTKTITLSPEFPGAVLTASGSATTNGSMTSDASASAVLSNYRSYYEWNSSETSLQDYTIMVRFTLPEDFSDWATTAITVNYNTELTTNNTAKLDFITYNADASLTGAFPYTPVSMRTNQVSATAKTWTSFSIPQTDLVRGQEHDIDAPGEQAIFYVKLYSKDNTHVQLGDIELNYLAKF